MDGENVQQGVVSTETTSPEVTQEVPAAQPQPLTEERVAQLVAAEVEKAKRHFQSVSDRMIAQKSREVADLQRRAQLAEEEAASLRTSVNELDPQAAEMARLKARDKAYSRTEAEMAAERQAQANADAVTQRLYAHLDKEGIDRTDKRVDWAQDTTDYHEGLNRFYDSVNRIKAEKVLAAAQRTMADQIKEEAVRQRKELGLDSVDTSSGSGVSGGEFAGIPTKAEELGRFIGGMSQEKYEKEYADKINKMRRLNLIR